MATEELLFTAADPPRVIDVVHVREDGTVVGAYGGKTVGEMEAEYGTEVRRGTIAEFRKVHDAAWRTEPEEITEERWDYYLNVLPPQGWGRANGVESFKMVEKLSGEVTVICARRGDRFWSFQDNASLPAHEIAARINALTA